MKFKITSPNGQVLRIKGDHYPTDEELTEIFTSVSPSKNTEGVVSENIQTPAREWDSLDYEIQNFRDDYKDLSPDLQNELRSRFSQMKERQAAGQERIEEAEATQEFLSTPAAFMSGLAGTATAGLSDVALDKMGFEEARKMAEKESPTAYTAGVISGLVGPNVVSMGEKALKLAPKTTAGKVLLNTIEGSVIEGTKNILNNDEKDLASALAEGAVYSAGADLALRGIGLAGKKLYGSKPVQTIIAKPVKGIIKTIKDVFGKETQLENSLGGKEKIIKAANKSIKPDGTLDKEKFEEVLFNSYTDEDLANLGKSISKSGRKEGITKKIQQKISNKAEQLDAKLSKMANEQADDVAKNVLYSQEVVSGITPSKKGLASLYHSNPDDVEKFSELISSGVPGEFVPTGVLTSAKEFEEAAGEFINNFGDKLADNQKRVKTAFKKLDEKTARELVNRANYQTLGQKQIPSNPNLSFRERDEMVQNRLEQILRGQENASPEELIAIGEHINNIGSKKVLTEDTILKNLKQDLNKIKEDISPLYKTYNSAWRNKTEAFESYNDIIKNFDGGYVSDLKKTIEKSPNSRLAGKFAIMEKYRETAKNSGLDGTNALLNKAEKVFGKEFANSLHQLDPQIKYLSKLSDMMLSSNRNAPDNIVKDMTQFIWASTHNATTMAGNTFYRLSNYFKNNYSPDIIMQFEKLLNNQNYADKLKILRGMTKDPLKEKRIGRFFNDLFKNTYNDYIKNISLNANKLYKENNNEYIE